MTDEQREAMKQIRVKQAIRNLEEISQKQSGLINGNFTAIAQKYSLGVRELRSAYETPEPAPRQNVPSWTMRDGTEIPVKYMKDSHLANAIAMVRRNAEEIREKMALEADIASGMTNGEQASFELEREARLLYSMPISEFLDGYEGYQNLVVEAERRHGAHSALKDGSDLAKGTDAINPPSNQSKGKQIMFPYTTDMPEYSSLCEPCRASIEGGRKNE